MPISALPAPYGIGTMGAAAREFADFLAKGGQSCWQILPVCPTSFGDSPYQSFSSYAGNPYFIDLEDLAAEGLLEPGEFRELNWGDDPGHVDYGLLYETRYPVLRRACGRLLAQDPPDFARFCREHGDWLEDYALFMALKERHGGASWFQWPEGERLRRPEALSAAREDLAGETAFWRAVQYLFFRQWKRLKEYTNSRGISIIGDLPIYVSADSADVWANPEQFQLDESGRPRKVAGVPPDYFNPDGQSWGNPVYDWEAMAKDGYVWWVRRIGHALKAYDFLRLDHFRGFSEYYAIPAGGHASQGLWQTGPGMALFEAVEKELGKAPPILGEDLGHLDAEVYNLLRQSGFPGMDVFQFEQFKMENASPGEARERIYYGSTHDSPTLRGWCETSFPETDPAEKSGAILRWLYQSEATWVLTQLQDLLGLGDEARYNCPGTVGPHNWSWQARLEQLTPEIAGKFRKLAEETDRI